MPGKVVFNEWRKIVFTICLPAYINNRLNRINRVPSGINRMPVESMISNTPFQNGWWISRAAIMDSKGNKEAEGSALVNTSTSWWWVRIGRSLIKPSVILSIIKRQSISMYFVRSWNIGLVAMFIAAWLSEKRTASPGCGTRKSVNNWWSQISSLTIETRAQYSASADDRKIVVCFLAFQEIIESPRKTQNLITDFRESKQEPQSASANAWSWKSNEEENNKHCLGEAFKYFRRWCAASRWGCLGEDTNCLSLWIANVTSGRKIVRYSKGPTNRL